jgi:hypothetical protein
MGDDRDHGHEPVVCATTGGREVHPGHLADLHGFLSVFYAAERGAAAFLSDLLPVNVEFTGVSFASSWPRPWAAASRR